MAQGANLVMSIDIRIDVNASRAIIKMEQMAERAKDFRPVFRWAKRELGLMNGQNFAQNGLPVGGWSPLNPQYAEWKSRNYPGRPDMVISKKLFNSLRNLNGPANRINKLTAEFGTDVEYAKFHQYGTNKMPKRQIVYEPAGFADRIALLAGRYLVDGTVGVGAGDLALQGQLGNPSRTGI